MTQKAMPAGGDGMSAQKPEWELTARQDAYLDLRVASCRHEKREKNGNKRKKRKGEMEVEKLKRMGRR